MTRIKVSYDSYYVNKETGYSAWVHVQNGSDDDYATHAGYHATPWLAENSAKEHAAALARAVRMAGKEPVIEKM